VTSTQSRTQTAQVTCITKPNRNSTVDAITHIGGDGWTLPVATAIAAIENKEWEFFTKVNGKKAVIGVRKTAAGKKFLQTHADGQWNNNLLALSECL
jgi:hypothetical protein